MANLSATLRVVQTYLKYAGYRVEDISLEENGAAKQDGHWLLGWCVHYSSGSMCPGGLPTALQTLFRMLEAGSEELGPPPRVGALQWTRASSIMALKVGGFPVIFNDETEAQ